MSLVGSYGTHLLHSFHPHLLQTLNHGMLANGGPASYFANERGLGKPSVLSNFQLPSAFSPPKYIGISLDQNLFNGNESFRTDSASPTCTSHESMEGSNDYDGEKGESPRSNNSDPRDLRHVHNKATASSAITSSVAAAAAALAVASTTSTSVTASHLTHAHHHPHHHHLSNGGLLAASMNSLSNCAGLRGVGSGLTAVGISGNGAGVGLSGATHIPDICPVCGIKLTAEDWNSHFLTELDRLYKLSSGMERTNLQATYMFAPPCPAQENAIRTSHNRWETFQRIRNNRQNRLRIKVRKRKFGNELYFMENLFCNSCPICKRKYAMETGKMPPEEEIETVDVESCNDDVPDSGSEIQAAHTQIPASGSSHGHSIHHGSSSSSSSSSSTGSVSVSSNMHNSNNQPGKLDGILYRTACVINKDISSEDDITTNVAASSSSSSSMGGNSSSSVNGMNGNNWNEPHIPHGHISVKNVSELSSTTHHFYNADSCGDERASNCNTKDVIMENCNNDSDEDVIVDDDDSIKMTNLSKKRKYEETLVSSRTSENRSPIEERPRSEPQVTSSEQSMEITNNNTKYTTFEELRAKQQQQMEADNGHSNVLMPGITQLDTKTGIKDFNSDAFFRGRNLYFHQSCANVMSTYRLSKDLQQQQSLLQQQQQESRKSPSNVTSANN
ncbi:protein Teyrha-meyrha isoform X2 [Teleopsis dalmanni]|uniref:protein Teyrha-meyrha isoform X2 n=1 Tax=Teleopsis dalmanni TaxID=139649 RepID=UPI0018CC913C|nr:protein Teyrha-meyrha isoform X2 [Teleopsis dalmanni]